MSMIHLKVTFVRCVNERGRKGQGSSFLSCWNAIIPELFAEKMLSFPRFIAFSPLSNVSQPWKVPTSGLCPMPPPTLTQSPLLNFIQGSTWSACVINTGRNALYVSHQNLQGKRLLDLPSVYRFRSSAFLDIHILMLYYFLWDWRISFNVSCRMDLLLFPQFSLSGNAFIVSSLRRLFSQHIDGCPCPWLWSRSAVFGRSFSSEAGCPSSCRFSVGTAPHSFWRFSLGFTSWTTMCLRFILSLFVFLSAP